MLQPDLRELLYDKDVGGGRSFTIIRRSKIRSKGRLSDGETETINAVGSVQPLGADALQQLPESDRTGQVIIARTETAMQIGSTSDTGDLLADEIEYNGDRFKILQLKNWGEWGIYAAIATRIGKADVVPPPVPEDPEETEDTEEPSDTPPDAPPDETPIDEGGD